jgi:hypothetical protein
MNTISKLQVLLRIVILQRNFVVIRREELSTRINMSVFTPVAERHFVIRPEDRFLKHSKRSRRKNIKRPEAVWISSIQASSRWFLHL